MSVIAVLQEADNLFVEPGSTTTCRLALSNTGSIVEQFTILFLGDAAAWMSADPPVVSMFPGAQQTVTLTFAPPRESTTPAGPVAFAVKVIPSNEPDESVTEEGHVTVGSFNDVGAELLPRVATGRVGGRQRLAVDSRGNVPIPIAIVAVDAADALQFRFSPSKLTAAPGAAHFIRVAIRPRQRFWRGPTQQKPYQIQVAAEGERPLVLDGGYAQKAILPKWLPALLAALAALVLLWFLVLKPAVRSEAVNAAKPALAASQAQQAQTAALAKQQAQTNAAVAALAGKPVPTTTTVPPTTTTTVPRTTTTTARAVAVVPTTSTLPPPVTSPTDGRLEAVAAPGSTALSDTSPVAPGTTLTVTNLVLQNVAGSAGTARIERLVPGQPAQDLLVENLSNLTDQEFTFTTPIVFTHDEQMQLRVDCSGNQTACDVGAYYTGPITQPVSATTTTIP